MGCVRHGVGGVPASSPRAVVVLHRNEPVSGRARHADHSLVAGRSDPGREARDDLGRIEDRWLTRGCGGAGWERAVTLLHALQEADAALGSGHKGRITGRRGQGEERRDDVASRFRVRRRPAGTHPVAPADAPVGGRVLRSAEPACGRLQSDLVIDVVSRAIVPRTVGEEQPHVRWPPGRSVARPSSPFAQAAHHRSPPRNRSTEDR